MRIAQIAPLSESVPPQSQNGLEFVVSWLTEELVRRGHEVTLFAPSDSITKAKLFSILPTGTNNDSTRSNHSFFTYWNSAMAGARAKEFDIIHGHGSDTSLLGSFIDTPIVVTLHHPASNDFLAPYLTDTRLKKTLRPIIESCRGLNHVAISENQRAGYATAEKSYLKKFSVIHNGVPLDRFSFNSKPKDYLLYIGYINQAKGADTAVRVANKLGMKLILAGNNYGEEKFFNEHIKPYLNKKIQYVGPVNFKEKNELYKNAIATLAPMTWDEPFGLTVIESQACGTPVIAYDRGAASELINDGVTGFVVKNEDEMVKAVKKISSLKRHACRKNVEQNFSVTKMVDDYERLYARLVKK